MFFGTRNSRYYKRRRVGRSTRADHIEECYWQHEKTPKNSVLAYGRTMCGDEIRVIGQNNFRKNYFPKSLNFSSGSPSSMIPSG